MNLQYDKTLVLAVSSKLHTNYFPAQTWTISALYEKLQRPHVDSITTAEYEALPTKREKAEHKGVIGGFVGGPFPNDTKTDGIPPLYRSILSLDLDSIPAEPDIMQRVHNQLAEKLGCSFAWYSTRGNSAAHPKLRCVIPLDRNVSCEEFERLTTIVCTRILQPEWADVVSGRAAQTMFWPTCSCDQEFYHGLNDAPFLCADVLMQQYPLAEGWEAWLHPKEKQQAAEKQTPQFRAYRTSGQNRGEISRLMHEAGESLNPYLPEYLDSHGYSSTGKFACPFHDDQEASAKYYQKNRWVWCYGCRNHYDLMDFIRLETGRTGRDLCEEACRRYGVPVPDWPKSAALDWDAVLYDDDADIPAAASVPETGAPEDFTEYYTLCRNRLSQTDYLQRRGIDPQVASRYWCGYDPAFGETEPFRKYTGGHVWKALIIPTGSGTFTARNTDASAARYAKIGTSSIFGWKLAAASGRPVFVTEGEIDALAVLSAGGMAVGLGTTGNAGKLIQLVESIGFQNPMILALDRDEAGQEAERGLCAALQSLHVPFICLNICGPHKDPGEAILHERADFQRRIQRAEDAARKLRGG